MNSRKSKAIETNALPAKKAKVSINDYQAFVHTLTEHEDNAKFKVKLNVFFQNQKFVKSDENDSVFPNNDFLQNNLVVGEKHDSVVAKNFLIKNLKLLKQNGFDTLFLEGFAYDYQADLDVYDPRKKYDTNKAAQAAYRMIEVHGFKNDPYKEKNNQVFLIGTAKALGFRVVGIDSIFALRQAKKLDLTTPEGYQYRLQSMNYIAFNIIKAEATDSKWVMLTGAYHTKTTRGVIGIADLTHANTIIVEECESNKEYNQINFNQHYKMIGETSAPVEAQIVVTPGTEAPLMSDLPQSMTQQQVNNTIAAYNNYKGKFFGALTLTTSKETKQVINDLQFAKDDQQRFGLSMDYLNKNPDKAFASELRKVLWPRKKCG